jgi:hypothetical protein
MNNLYANVEELQAQLEGLKLTIQSMEQQKHLPQIMVHALKNYPRTIQGILDKYNSGIISLQELILQIDLQNSLTLRRYISAVHGVEGKENETV